MLLYIYCKVKKKSYLLLLSTQANHPFQVFQVHQADQESQGLLYVLWLLAWHRKVHLFLLFHLLGQENQGAQLDLLTPADLAGPKNYQ